VRQRYILAQESFQNNFFDTEYLKADLKGRSVRGGAITVFAQGCRFVLQTGSTVVLARLLTPADFGLIAMVAAVTNFGVMFKDMGLSMATVQKANINHSQISTLFWINVAVGIVIAGLLAALAPLVAGFYGDPRLTPVTMALAGVFIFGGLTVQHQALLRRHMRFLALGLVTIIAMAAGVAAAIIAGVYGAGYWSLVIMHIVLAVATAAGVWIAFPWRPGLPKSKSGVREMLGFGRHIIGFNLINYFHRNLDNILLGKFFGAFVLGLYSKAYGLLMLPIRQLRAPISSVAIVGLSRIQSEPEKFKRYYVKVVSILAFTTMPLMVFLAVYSEELIELILGQQWLQAAGIFRILAVAAFIQPVFTTRGMVLLALGQSRRYLKTGMIQSFAFLVAVICGLPWGAKGIATSYAISNYAMLVPMFIYCFKYTPLSIQDFAKAIWRPAVVSIGLAIGLIAIRQFISYSGIVLILITGLSGGLLIYFVLWFIMPGGKRILQELLELFSLLLQKKARDFRC